MFSLVKAYKINFSKSTRCSFGLGNIQCPDSAYAQAVVGIHKLAVVEIDSTTICSIPLVDLPSEFVHRHHDINYATLSSLYRLDVIFYVFI